MKIIKKAVKIELILISFIFIILLLIPFNYAGSLDSSGTSEWRMFQRDLNHIGVYSETINICSFDLLQYHNGEIDFQNYPQYTPKNSYNLMDDIIKNCPFKWKDLYTYKLAIKYGI